MSTAESIVNRALASCGCESQAIGDIQQGTKAARVALRHYLPCLETLLRGCYWNFARAQEPLQLLGARPGFGPAVNSNQQQPYGNAVIPPWLYEYAWPIDCIAARFVPWNNNLPQSATPAGNIAGPPVPPTTYDVPFQSPATLIPARMLVANSTNYPLPIPSNTPPQQWWNTRGATPALRTVVLTNVPRAELVYTRFIPYPNLWDPLFEQAMVSLLSTYLALECNPDRKEARALRSEQVALAKAAIGQARVRDGNEGTNILTHTPDWIRARNRGASYAGWGGFEAGGPGVLGYGASAVCFGDGTSY